MKWEFYNREKFECPNCHEFRFVRMVNERGEFYPENVGRCDRENSCTYMYHASKYLKDHPNAGELFNLGKVDQPKRQVIGGHFSFDIELFERFRDDTNYSNKRFLSWDSGYTGKNGQNDHLISEQIDHPLAGAN